MNSIAKLDQNSARSWLDRSWAHISDLCLSNCGNPVINRTVPYICVQRCLNYQFSGLQNYGGGKLSGDGYHQNNEQSTAKHIVHGGFKYELKLVWTAWCLKNLIFINVKQCEITLAPNFSTFENRHPSNHQPTPGPFSNWQAYCFSKMRKL